MKKNFLLIFCILNFLCLHAQNDLCDNAIALSPSNNCNYVTGSFNGSSISTAPPSCTPNASQDVWYSFVATEQTIQITLQANSNVNHAFEVFQGSCTSNSLVCVNNNGISFGETYINNNFIVGQTYYVRVLNASGNLSTANFGICIQNYPTPANDLCTNAISIQSTTTCNYISGTFSGSSISTPPPSCASSSSQDVWYRFVATDSTMSIALQANSNVNHAFEVFQASCSGSSVVCMNNNGISFGETYINNNFVVGQTYYVRVINTSSGLSIASFNVCIQSYFTPTNDVCNNAAVLTPTTTCSYIPGTFSGSSISTTAPSCAFNSLQDLWYSFIATDATMSVTLQPNSNANLAFEIFQSSCADNSLVCINNNPISFGEFYTNNNFIVGQTYIVRVLNALGNLSTTNFGICVQNPTLSLGNFQNPKYIIHPNPAQNIITVNTSETIKEIIVFDMSGKKVTIVSSSINSIDISSLSQGLYTISIVGENETYSSKFIKN
ncbi:MAG: T9SS type A sorting domain-containing protein [Flavobacteriales bacterium]|nr:T9SS type A sorting domain-containing protein [Flavobacteriales bacterium]